MFRSVRRPQLHDPGWPPREEVDAERGSRALLNQRGSTSLRAPSLAHCAVARSCPEESSMPLNSERVRPRRTPRLGFPPERPPFTPERLRRRRADYRRFRALIQTPEGCVQFMQEYVRVAPEAGTAKVF